MRNRRPPTDAINCLLSFCYGLLAKECWRPAWPWALIRTSGCFTGRRFGRPALALDLAEEFRPLLADSTVLTLVNNREVGAVRLRRPGRGGDADAGRAKAVIRAWERRMTTQMRHPMFGYMVSYRRAVELQARILAAHLIGELPEYEPLVTR